MISELCIWYLRKRKKSVLIGYKMKGDTIQALNNDAFVYDNELEDITNKLPDGRTFNFPPGKFSLSTKHGEESQ